MVRVYLRIVKEQFANGQDKVFVDTFLIIIVVVKTT